MKPLLSCLCAVLLALMSGIAAADDDPATAMQGSYLLFQNDKYQRVLSLGAGGVAQQVSEEETVVGFTSGQGNWAATGTNTANVKIIDFTYNLGDGKPVGPTVTVFELRFADQANGKFQKVEGVFNGAQHARGQDVLTTESQPLRTYRVRFSGQRITTD